MIYLEILFLGKNKLAAGLLAGLLEYKLIFFLILMYSLVIVKVYMIIQTKNVNNNKIWE